MLARLCVCLGLLLAAVLLRVLREWYFARSAPVYHPLQEGATIAATNLATAHAASRSLTASVEVNTGLC